MSDEVMRLVKMIEDVVGPKLAIVTFNAPGRGWLQKYDVQRKVDGLQWGYDVGHFPLLCAKLANPDSYPLSIVVRSFTEDTEGGLPVKEIRGYYAPSPADLHKLSPEQMRECNETDCRTSKPLKPEPAVRYVV